MGKRKNIYDIGGHLGTNALLDQFNANNLAKTNYKAKDFYSTSIGEIGNTALSGIGAISNFATGNVVGGIKNTLGTLFSVGNIFSKNKEARDTASELNNSNKLANEAYINNFNSMAANNQNSTFNRSLLTLMAEGGNLKTPFNIPNGISQINNGGSHETNPYGGVPFGMDNNGIPNVVEEGEVVYNDFVFSNRIKVPNSNKTFAEKAKSIQKEFSEKPNDPISKRTTDTKLSELASLQEKIKQENSINQLGNTLNNQYAKGGQVDVEDWELMPTTIDKAVVTGNSKQINPIVGRAVSTLQRPDSVVIPESFRPTIRRLNPNIEIEDPLEGLDLSDNLIGGTGSINVPEYHIPQLPDLDYDSLNLENEPILQSNFKDKLDLWKFINASNREFRKFRKGIKPLPYVKEVYDEIEPAVAIADAPTKVVEPPKSTTDKKDEEVKPVKDKEVKDEEVKYVEGEKNNGATIASAALMGLPILGQTGMVLSDMLGQTNKPDYSETNMLEQYAREAPQMSPSFIGNYLEYNPLDRNYYLNQLRAQSAATNKAIQNQAINSGMALAGLVNAGYNTQNAIGNLARQSEEYNRNQQLQTETFNRGTNQYNADSKARTDATNIQTYNNMLSGIANAAQMRAQERLQSEAAKSANMSNLFDMLGTAGKAGLGYSAVVNNPGIKYNPFTGTYIQTPTTTTKKQPVTKEQPVTEAYGGKIKTRKRNRRK